MIVIAKKRIKHEIRGDIETETYHKVGMGDNDLYKELFDLAETHMEEPEDAFCKGIIMDFEGDLYSLTLKEFIPIISERLKELKEDEEMESYDQVMKTYTYLAPWKEYTLYFSSQSTQGANK